MGRSLLYYDPAFLEHETGRHPECAERLRRVVAHLQSTPLWDRCEHPTVTAADPATVGLVHTAEHLANIREVAARGGGRVEADTVMSRGSYQAAMMAVGAACDAVARVVQGRNPNAFCLLRPPGHHALPHAPMGFCLFNAVAVAARFALRQLGLQRVLIVDWDVHHGNGTQDTFYDTDEVGFYSIHRSPFYPFTGDARETGRDAGLGYTCNVPLAFGITREEYLRAFRDTLAEFAAKVRPELILVSAGFDAHRLDPIGSLGLETEDFRALTETVLSLAGEFCQFRVVGLLEGGYNVEMLGHCVEQVLDRLVAQAD